MKPIHIAYVATMEWSFNRRALHGLALYCRAHQWSLEVWAPAHLSPALLRKRTDDGFVIGAYPLESRLQRLLDRPAVCLSAHRAHQPLPRVCTDDPAVGRTIAEHLFDQGFQHLAYVGDPAGGWWSRRRLAGFSERAAELGVTCAAFGTDSGQPKNPATRDRACTAWLRKLPRPFGLMACNDAQAQRTIALCRRLNLRLPEDVAVVGVDNDDLFVEMANPPLSSMVLQNDRIGYVAGALLGRLIAGRSPPRKNIVVPPGELIVRRSSDTLAIEDPIIADAVRLIRRRLSEQINVKQLLAQIPLSRSTLDTRFRQALGRSAAEEIRRARIMHAKHLLSTSDLSMPHVAKHAGFSCARQLSETFHHETGRTPTAYRRQFRLRDELD